MNLWALLNVPVGEAIHIFHVLGKLVDIVGAIVAHAIISMVRDYDPRTQYNNLLGHDLWCHDAITSHLNWIQD